MNHSRAADSAHGQLRERPPHYNMLLVCQALFEISINSVSEFQNMYYTTNVTIMLSSDLDFANVTDFHPVSFVGEFDGQDHTIKNVFVSQLNYRNDYAVAGVFDLNNSQYNIIKNLHLLNVTVRATIRTQKLYAGILTGFGQPDCYNITIADSQIITDGLNSRYTGAVIGYIPVLRNWCNYSYVRMKNVTVTGFTVHFQQLGSSMQHIYGGLVGYTNQRLEITHGKAAGTVYQTQLNQFTVVGGAVGKIGYYASLTLTNVSVYTTFNMQLHKNGLFGNFVGQNQHNKHTKYSYCFGGVYGESYHVPVHIVGYNCSYMNVGQVVVDYEVEHNRSTTPITATTTAAPSVYVYVGDHGDYENLLANVTLVESDQRANTSLYALLDFVSEHDQGYWRHKPHKYNFLPYLDAPVTCRDNLTRWDDALQRCVCVEHYEFDQITGTCQFSCPRGPPSYAICSGHGHCVLESDGLPKCKCADPLCKLPDCGCPACPPGCICDENDVCIACKDNFDNLFNNCDHCMEGYVGEFCEKQLRDSNSNNLWAIGLTVGLVSVLSVTLGTTLGLRRRRLLRKNRLVPSAGPSGRGSSGDSGKLSPATNSDATQIRDSHSGTQRGSSASNPLRLSDKAQQDMEMTRFNDGSGAGGVAQLQDSVKKPARVRSQMGSPARGLERSGRLSAGPRALPDKPAATTPLAAIGQVGSTVPVPQQTGSSGPKRKRVKVKAKHSVYDELVDDFGGGKYAHGVPDAKRRPVKISKMARAEYSAEHAGHQAHLMPLKRRAPNQGPALDVLADE